MSTVAYNGVTIPLTMTHDFTNTVVMDDSGTDKQFHKVTFTCQTVISTPLTQGLGRTNAESPATTMGWLYNKLMTPRKTFSVMVNSVEVIPAPPTAPDGNDSTDLKNGPIPQYCKIKQLTEATFLLDWSVVGHYLDPVYGNAVTIGTHAAGEGKALASQTTGILSHRWRDSVTIDEEFYSHRTRQGKIVIASGINKSIDRLRESLITTSIEPGHVRESSNYVVEESGLALAYNITDREVYRMPPAPSVKADGQYIETSAGLGRPFRTGDVQVKLRGCKTSDQGDMLRIAILIARQKFLAEGGLKTFITQQAVMRVSLYENEIEFRMQVRFPTNKKRVGDGVMAADLSRFTASPAGSYPGATPPDPGTRGTANILLHAAAYNDPFLQSTLDRQTNQLTAGVVPGG